MPPQFLYAFSGTTLKLQRPVGVMIDGDNVYVPDSTGRQVLVFSQAGKYKRSFGASQTVIPLNIAKNPKNNELYVTDRRMRTIFRYDLAGKYLGEFKPNLPKDQLPDVPDRRRPVGAGGARVRAGRHAVRDRDPQRPPVADLRTRRQVQEVGRQRWAWSSDAKQRRRALPVPQRHHVPQGPGLRHRQQQPSRPGLRQGRQLQADHRDRGPAARHRLPGPLPVRQGARPPTASSWSTRWRTTARSGPPRATRS